MIPVLSATQMREADRRTIEELGLPGAVLMENAGTAVAEVIRARFPQAARLLILCGRGNNGGDGFVIARRLEALRPTVVLLGSRHDVQGDARLHLGIYERTGGLVREAPDVEAWRATAQECLADADLIVDALFGTGLTRAPEGVASSVIEDVVAHRQRRAVPLVAVDLPSGLPSDSGEVPWPTLSADVTVTFAAPKCGHVLPPACDRVGELIVADIGIPFELLESGARLGLLEAADAARAFPRRAPGAHKGDYGHLLVVGGSVGKTGAAILAATAALRSGAGLVTVATASPALPVIAAARAELMTEPLAATEAGTIAAEALERVLALAADRDALVLGPGLGQHPETRTFVRELVRRCAKPLVLDADGLNALCGSSGCAGATDLLRREHPTIATPHPGEMARLIGQATRDVQRQRLETARRLAVETGATIVLKGQRTVIARADGYTAVNPTGNPGMATAGAGDVLSGLIGALLARGHEAWLAATAAVYVHGAAGDLAAGRLGQESLVAGDLIESLPVALQGLTA